MADVYVHRNDESDVMVYDENNGEFRLFISTIDTTLEIYTLNGEYTAREIRNQLQTHENPDVEPVLKATIIHPSLEYGQIDQLIIDETNHYVKNAIASLFTELGGLGENEQLQVFKEILDSSIIEEDTIEDARARVKRYSGKSVRLRECSLWAPNDIFPVASTISIIKELSKIMGTRGYNSYNKAYARFQMGLVELAQRELSLQEMNFFLNGRIENDITTTESTFSPAFRQSDIDTNENPYLNDTLPLIHNLEESFLGKIAEERSGNVIIVEPNKINREIQNDVNAGYYEITIKAKVPVSSW